MKPRFSKTIGLSLALLAAGPLFGQEAPDREPGREDAPRFDREEVRDMMRDRRAQWNNGQMEHREYRLHDRRGAEFLRHVVMLHREAMELHEREFEIDEMRERVEEQVENDRLEPEQAERRERIIELRSELLELEREEFAFRVHEHSTLLLERVENRLESEQRLRVPRDMAEAFAGRLQEIHEASGEGFEELYDVLRDKGILSEMADKSPPYEQRLRHEVKILRERLNRLEQELGEDGDGFEYFAPPAPDPGPPPIAPEDRAQFQGTQDPAPPAARRDRQSRGREER